jgi:hypothetical protein
MRKIANTINTATGHETRVYKDVEWNEYRIKHYVNGQHLVEADYHTDDKEEALHHGAVWPFKPN